jgi:hypothetical protein
LIIHRHVIQLKTVEAIEAFEAFEAESGQNKRCCQPDQNGRDQGQPLNPRQRNVIKTSLKFKQPKARTFNPE